MQQWIVNHNQEKRRDAGETLAEVNEPVCSREGFLMATGADLCADQNGCGTREAAEEGDDDAFQRPEDGSCGDGGLDLVAKHDVDEHVADSDHHFIGNNRSGLAQICG